MAGDQGPGERQPGNHAMPIGAIGAAPGCGHPDVPGLAEVGHDQRMTRQRGHRGAPGVASEPEGGDEAAARLGLSPAELTRELATADDASRVRTMGDMQAAAGNAALGGLLAGSGHATGFGMGRGALAAPTTRLTVSRDIDDAELAGTGDEQVPLDTGGTTNATENVGPAVESSYAVVASSLADVVAVIGGRAEAGHVGWSPTLDFHQTDGRIDSVTISVPIDLEMPSWSPPAAMLPRARAEWTRWYAALRAHEQGHIDLVHQLFDGLAGRILGTRVATGQRLFQNAKASLATRSRAYDARTGHGTRQGTILDVAIEQQELDEERRKREAAEKAKGRESAVPDVGDEEE